MKKFRPKIFTIGHSTHSFEEFVQMLRAHGVGRLIDVRTIPRSRRNPQFNRDVLSKSLKNRRIGYRHLQDLGGLRRAKPGSINTGWRNASFRGYADYMQTSAFENALARLIKLGEQKTIAIMCAEAVPWRCHRSLIADALTVRGYGVYDIMSSTKVRQHVLNPLARVCRGKLTYPPEAS